MRTKKRPIGILDHESESKLRIEKGMTAANPQSALINAETDTPRIRATIAEYRKFATDILTDLGLPTDWPSLLGHFDDNKLEPEWYARKMLFLAKSLEEHLVNQNAEGAAFAALRLQSAMAQLLVSRMEHAALSGNLLLTTPKKEVRNSQPRKQDWERRAADLRQKGKISAREIARIIATETGGEESAIRAHLGKLAKGVK